MIIQEEKVEIVDDEKPKALQKTMPKDIQKQEEKPEDIQVNIYINKEKNSKWFFIYILIF